jgi:hypothetical protein
MALAARLFLAAAASLAGCTGATASVEISGSFVAGERCQALDSIRRETNPGNVQTVPGRSYRARALNKRDGDYVHIEIPDAVPRIRWVKVDCGTLDRKGREPQRGDEARRDSGFAPFFVEGGTDHSPTPPPPRLNGFDEAMLKVCGDWGSRPKQATFRAALDEPAIAPDVERIYQALDGGVLGPRRELPQFKDELAAVWFGEDGFRHVYCGEPSGGTIGGLHFAGRYLQMQQEGWGGLATRCNSSEIAPPIYTIGVRYRIPRGGHRTACPKGYALNLDASEILVEGTKAFKLLLARASGKSMCLFKVAEPNVREYLAVFVIKNRAVRTFYPDASPRCDNQRPAEDCLCQK